MIRDHWKIKIQPLFSSEKSNYIHHFSQIFLSVLTLEVPKKQPQISFLAGFSVWFGLRTPKKTTTNIISRGFLCMIWPSWSEKDIHKYHFSQASLYDVPFESWKGGKESRGRIHVLLFQWFRTILFDPFLLAKQVTIRLKMSRKDTSPTTHFQTEKTARNDACRHPSRKSRGQEEPVPVTLHHSNLSIIFNSFK